MQHQHIDADHTQPLKPCLGDPKNITVTLHSNTTTTLQLNKTLSQKNVKNKNSRKSTHLPWSTLFAATAYTRSPNTPIKIPAHGPPKSINTPGSPHLFSRYVFSKSPETPFVQPSRPVTPPSAALLMIRELHLLLLHVEQQTRT